jgi:hypothetical protein
MFKNIALLGNTQGKRSLGRRRLVEKIILKWMEGKWISEYRLDSTGSGQYPMMVLCEHSNETSGSTRT